MLRQRVPSCAPAREVEGLDGARPESPSRARPGTSGLAAGSIVSFGDQGCGRVPFFAPETGCGLQVCAEHGMRPASLASILHFHVMLTFLSRPPPE